MTIKAKPLVKIESGPKKWSNGASGLGTDHLIFTATLIATLVVGYPADIYGIVTWLATLLPLPKPWSARHGHL
jgi:hypothetical protein